MPAVPKYLDIPFLKGTLFLYYTLTVGPLEFYSILQYWRFWLKCRLTISKMFFFFIFAMWSVLKKSFIPKKLFNFSRIFGNISFIWSTSYLKGLFFSFISYLPCILSFSLFASVYVSHSVAVLWTVCSYFLKSHVKFYIFYHTEQNRERLS